VLETDDGDLPGVSDSSPDLSANRRAALRALLERAGAAAGRAQPAGRATAVSFSQERLWVLDQIRPRNPAWNVPTAFRLRGRLRPDLLQAALDEVVRRHDVLRACFASTGGTLEQLVAPSMALPVQRHDLSGLPPAEREAEARRLVAALTGQPFDLDARPLARVALVRLAADEHVLLLVLHHIISDGWSLGVLYEELAAVYGALLESRPSPLPDLPMQYADYAAAQREEAQDSWMDDEASFWRQHLAGAPLALDLPADRVRPAMVDFTGGNLVLGLDEGLSERIRRLSRECRASPFMTLLAAFALLLGRLAGQDDVLVGAPVAGRTQVEHEQLIGCFTTNVVLRVRLDGRPTFRELVGRARTAALTAYEHAELPFERIVDELQPPRDMSRPPVCQVLLNYGVPDSTPGLAGLTATPYVVETATAKFDLTLYVHDRAGISLTANYASELFTEARIEELLRQFAHLLDQAAEAPDRPADELSLVTDAGRHALPDPRAWLDATWRGSVPALLQAHAAAAPDAPAVAGALTYGELADRAARLAGGLAAAGVGRGDVVCVHAARDPALVVALAGVLWAGAAFAILDPAYPAARLAEQAAACRPAAWIELAGALPGALEAPAAAARCRLRLDGAAPASGRAPLPDLGPDDVAYVAFTSGSTGRPRAVLGRHGPLTHFLPWLRDRFGLGPDDRFSMLSGLAHDPLHRDVFTPLGLGAAICCPPPDAITAGLLPAWLGAAGVTVAHLTPALGQVATEPAPGAVAGGLPALRLAFFVGDVLTRRDVARLRRLAPDVTVVNYYGSTETQRAVGFHVVDPDQHARAHQVLPLGRGIDDVQLLVLDPAGRQAGCGELGEVHVRSPHLAAGYLDDAALTAERFVVNPFTGDPDDRLYRTGDLGRHLPDGEVEPAGRADRQVKVLGNRVELGEVEAELGRHPAVGEAAVSLREGRLVAHVALLEPVDDRTLRTALRERLPDFMVPAAIVRVEALPLTPNGKLDVARLPAPEAPAATDAAQPPADELEAALAATWRAELGVQRVIDRRESLFDLGASSLDVIRVHGRLQERFGAALSVVDLFRHPSLAELAAHLREAPPPSRGRRSGHGPEGGSLG
jgi:amino acid adenylation domain-containing protein